MPEHDMPPPFGVLAMLFAEMLVSVAEQVSRLGTDFAARNQGPSMVKSVQ
jgi:hypothetical protein